MFLQHFEIITKLEECFKNRLFINAERVYKRTYSIDEWLRVLDDDCDQGGRSGEEYTDSHGSDAARRSTT